MQIKAFLARFVVVWRHEQAGINTQFGRSGRQRDGFSGRVRAGTGNYGNSTICQADHLSDHITVLINIQRSRFTCSTNNNYRIGVVVYVEFNQTLESCLINIADLIHRRDEGNKATVNHVSCPQI
ncbi:hypothetical protein BMS3Bbin11_01099 [bacterium BMS3Bbin11]|nr:hypothetical protein BMS3Bbin11_01099 [bacterium BMS3Bbin11]